VFQNPDLLKLEGKNVILEKLNSQASYSDLYEMAISDSCGGEKLLQFMNFGPFESIYEFRDWLRIQEENNTRKTYTIYWKERKKYVGMYSILNIDCTCGRAELGSIWIGTIAQRTKVNSECAFLCLSMLFDNFRYRRIEWKCDNENINSKISAQKLGFTFEGIFRKHMIVKNKNRDTAWFSIIEDEWPNVKMNLEQKLASNI